MDPSDQERRGPIELRSKAMVVDVDPAAGGEVTRVSRPGGINALARYGWESPCRDRRSATYGDSQHDWLSRYRGGWQELIPNSGAACVVDGVPMSFHGDASLAEWTVLSAAGDRCELRCPTRLPLVVERTMEIDAERPVLRVEEQVVNESDLELAFLWGHHPVFPAVAGARLDLPACVVEPETSIAAGAAPGRSKWPHLRLFDGTLVDLREVLDRPLERVVYLSEMAGSWAAVRQPGAVPGVAMAWDPETFPCMWIWLQRHSPDFPHFGRSEMLGLEPHAAWPFDGLAAAIERGRALRIGAGETRRSWLTMTLLADGGRTVTGVERDGTVAFGDPR